MNPATKTALASTPSWAWTFGALLLGALVLLWLVLGWDSRRREETARRAEVKAAAVKTQAAQQLQHTIENTRNRKARRRAASLAGRSSRGRK